MGRRAAIFTVDDVARAFKGAEKAGVSVARCEITKDGRIVVIPGAPEPDKKPPLAKSEEGYL